MIKNIKQHHPDALINSEKFRKYVSDFESEILRGISTLSILTVINRNKERGIYGYKLVRDLMEETSDMLVIEEGTVYPILRKLLKDEILSIEAREIEGRYRKYYFITSDGIKVYNHLIGFFTKLIEALAPLMDIRVNLLDKRFLYCPNCANKIDISEEKPQLCNVCGLNLINLESLD